MRYVLGALGALVFSGSCATAVAPIELAAGALGARIDDAGAIVLVGGHDSRIALRGLGRGEPEALPPAHAGASSPYVELRRPGIVEWWRELDAGLEHGVTLAERAAGEGDLVLDVGVSGDLRPTQVGDEVALVDASGTSVARYGGLLVVDARGERVPARLATTGDAIRIVVDDRRATYPLVVDPIVAVAEATLVAPDPDVIDYLGWAVALSGDGTRALVSAYVDDTAAGTFAGSVRVFVRSGTSWTQETTLLAPDAAAQDRFGTAIALSGDGTRAAIASPGYGTGTERVQVFVRTGTSWSFEQTLGFGTDGEEFGRSVALDATGARLLVGYPGLDVGAAVNAGGAVLYTRSGTTWTPAASASASTTSSTRDGAAVALSADGTRGFVLGSTGVVVYRLMPGPVLETTLAPATGGSGLATGLAVDATGSRVVAGAPREDTTPGTQGGAARVFLRTGTSWALEARLTPSSARAGDEFGDAAAISADGTRVVVGAPFYDRVTSDDGRASLYVRSGTSWALSQELSPTDVLSGHFAVSIGVSDDGSRALFGVPEDRPSGIDRAGTARVYRLPASDGTSCSAASQCQSGFCVDGVCCASACGGGAADCQACSVAASGTTDGTCTPLSAAVAPTQTCRPSAGACDVAEVCSSSSTSCPADAFAAGTLECRASTGACDPAELCPGTGAACPADARAPAGTTCRASRGGCDPAELCDGAAAACPSDVVHVAGTECRAAAGPCDQREVCAGGVDACPPDLLVSAGTSCRPMGGPCDIADACTGSSAACPDTFVPAGTQCAPMAGPCDVADFCTGSSAACPSTFATAGTLCLARSGEPCDTDDVCDGLTAGCPPTYVSGAVCRPSVGGCDLAESCSGTAAACPPDGVSPAGTVCRASTDLGCDPLESCDGLTTTCPNDVVTCASDAGVDAGRDASAGATDASRADAGTPAPVAGGCACSAVTARTNGWALLPLLGGLAILRRRARAARRHERPRQDR